MERAGLGIEADPPLDCGLDSKKSTIDDLDDDCLAFIFQSLISMDDLTQCSLVCRRWFKIEGQSRRRLCLTPPSSISLPSILAVFSRFNSVTDLSLNCVSATTIGDEALHLISQCCPDLTSLTILYSDVTDAGLEAFARNLNGLKKFTCQNCPFGYKGLNALMHHCPALHQLHATNLLGITDGVPSAAAASSLEAVVLSNPIIRMENLTILNLVMCEGNCDEFLHRLVDQNPCLVEIHLENLEISDIGLEAISKCRSLEKLHIVKNGNCSDEGVVAIVEGCKLLRELHIDGWMTDRIGDKGLLAIAESCFYLQELILIGVTATLSSFEILISNYRSLERLIFCPTSIIGDIHLYDIVMENLQGRFTTCFLPDFVVYYWRKDNRILRDEMIGWSRILFIPIIRSNQLT